MGIIHSGVPEELVLKLKGEFEIKNFIETGTYFGQTARKASEIFDNVFTIEMAKEIYTLTSSKYRNLKNINFIYGDSKVELKKIIKDIKEPTIFWLDAHYSGGSTYNGECPLKKEIDIINSFDSDAFILIDDARFVLSPYLGESYGELVEILQELNVKDRYIIVLEDVIIAVPRKAKSLIDEYCEKVTNRQWKEYGQTNKSIWGYIKNIVKYIINIKK